jgi:hypothetical protein
MSPTACVGPELIAMTSGRLSEGVGSTSDPKGGVLAETLKSYFAVHEGHAFASTAASWRASTDHPPQTHSSEELVRWCGLRGWRDPSVAP